MKKIKNLLLFSYAILFVFTSGCSGIKGISDNEKHTTTIFAMDTVMELTVYGDGEVLKEAEELIKDLEEKFSVTSETGDIYALNSSKSAEVSEETYSLMKRGLEICERTGGVLDLTVYPVVRAWGFTTQSYQVPVEETLKELLSNVDYTKILLSENGRITIPAEAMTDLGSVAKGFTGDKLMELFKEKGLTSALVNLGGNVQALGAKPDGSAWKVAIASPKGNGDYAGVVSVKDKAVITSGAYERFFEENGRIYHHIIDTSTGYPAESGLLSVTVIGKEGTLCDGLSTSLFAMGLEKSCELWERSDDFDAVFITEDGRIYVTEGVREDFSPLGEYAKVVPEVLYHD